MRRVGIKFDHTYLPFFDKFDKTQARQELSNEYVLAKIGFETAEKEPYKVC